MEEERQARLLSGQSSEVPPHCLWRGGKSRRVCVCVCVWLKARRGLLVLGRSTEVCLTVYLGMDLVWWTLEGGEQHSVRWLTSSFIDFFLTILKQLTTQKATWNFGWSGFVLSLPLPLFCCYTSALELEDRGRAAQR